MSYIYVYVATNGRTAQEGKNNSYGKPRRMDKMDKNREEAENGKKSGGRNKSYSIHIKICV